MKITVEIDGLEFIADGWYVEAGPDTYDTPGHDAYFNLIEVYHKGEAFSNFICPLVWDKIQMQALYACQPNLV